MPPNDMFSGKSPVSVYELMERTTLNDSAKRKRDQTVNNDEEGSSIFRDLPSNAPAEIALKRSVSHEVEVTTANALRVSILAQR